jgi:hypothetical protein
LDNPSGGGGGYADATAGNGPKLATMGDAADTDAVSGQLEDNDALTSVKLAGPAGLVEEGLCFSFNGLLPEAQFTTIDPHLAPHSPTKTPTQPASPAPHTHPRLIVLHKLIAGLPRQLAEASEFNFSFSNVQPTEEELEDYSLSGVYHNTLAAIFGPRAGIRKLSHEDRINIHTISTRTPVEGQISPIQKATLMDGSVLWGRGAHALKIVDDFEAALNRLPGDGPLLNWVENLINMARSAYALFHRPVSPLIIRCGYTF